jgi:DNA-binding transcriptional ArsR family regulator
MRLRNVMAPAVPLEVRSGPSFELLITLYAGAGPAGELWLHLLGLALESDDLVGRVEELRPLELRRHLVGVFVPSWRRLVGADTLEQAARGDPAAARRLLAHPRYYAGRARASLQELLPLSARETKARILAELRSAPTPDTAMLDADAAAKRTLAEEADPLDVIEAACGGYRYEPEPDTDRVVLVPHLSGGRAVLLCQHRRTRIICYPAAVDEPTERDRLLLVGRALGDPRRLAILERLRRGEASLDELSAEIGLARSTTHHHLAQLRAARLISFRGNAAGYFYMLDPDAFGAAAAALAGFVRP